MQERGWQRVRTASLTVAGLCLAAVASAQTGPSSLQPRARLPMAELLQQEAGPVLAAGTQERSPSLRKALFFSALLPGAGEYYAGHPNRALLFGTLEAGIWISYATFKVQEDLRRERAIEYAVAVAGALPPPAVTRRPQQHLLLVGLSSLYGGTAAYGDDAYYAAMAQFMRSDGPGQWNEFVRRRSRETGEVVGVEYTGDAGWAWPSEQQFIDYRDLRKSQLTAEDRATNMLAVAIVNRIASMVDVFHAMRSDAHQVEPEGFELGLRLGRTIREPLACVALQRRF